MKFTIKVEATFAREAKRLCKKYKSIPGDIEDLGRRILEDPKLGTDLGGGLRKIRMRITSKGKGKSGGARVITFTVVVSVEETEISLLYIYDKAERSTISKTEIEQLLLDNGLK